MTDWKRLIGITLEDVGFDAHDNGLRFGSSTLADVLSRADGGPAYVYHAPSVALRTHRLRRTLDQRIRLRYAVKANPFSPLLRYLAPLVDGFDVASGAEISAAVAAGAATASLSLAGPGKSPALLEGALARGTVISIESEQELARAAEAARRLGVKPQILLRINPTFGLRGSGMHMAGLSSPFGIDSEQALGVLERLPPDLDFCGFHVFCGSQCLSTEALVDAHRQTCDLVCELAAAHRRPLRSVCIGAGFGIPYFAGDRPLDLDTVAERLNALAEHLHASQPGIDVQLEMGRYLVGEAGVYLCRVMDKKYSRGEVFLITNGGMHHHLAASGNLGQVIKRNYPVCIANRLEGEQQEKVTITGPLCTPLDVLARGVTLPKAQVGDTVAVFQSGAYGLSASPTAFLGHPPPAEILLEQ